MLCIDWFQLLRTGIDRTGRSTVKLSIRFFALFKYLPTESTCSPLVVPYLPLMSVGHTFSCLAVILILVGDTNAQNSSLVSYLKIPFTLAFILDIGIHIVVGGEQFVLVILYLFQRQENIACWFETANTWSYFVLWSYTNSSSNICLLQRIFELINIFDSLRNSYLFSLTPLWLSRQHTFFNLGVQFSSCMYSERHIFKKLYIYFIFKQVHKGHIISSTAINIQIQNDVPWTEIHSEVFNN